MQTRRLAQIGALVLVAAASARAQYPEIGLGWMAEFSLASRQIKELAEAIPADKYSWRPAPGVRSVSDVLMHVALGNFYLLDQAGGKIPDDTPAIRPDFEKKITAKADVLAWLDRSAKAVKQVYPAVDRSKRIKFLGKDTTSDAVFLRILVHSHEHMGQMIAYARMVGVTPPWSK
ncbi:MAG: DinB family protein [Acidobacteria bacterium]|nr:DinB family protein [Acidobacteriota bacterium]